MPRTARPPAYRLHKARNYAVVTIRGKNHYLGTYGTPESYEAYARLVAGIRVDEPHARISDSPPSGATKHTVNHLILAYVTYAEGYYRKDGQPTDDIYGIKAAMRPLRKLYGTTPAVSFGPLALKAVRDQMVALGHSRNYVNTNIDRIRRMFKWAASEELVAAQLHQALMTVAGLRAGRTTARATEPIEPVPIDVVLATLPELTPPVAAMVQLQLMTGMRPGEVTRLRPSDLVQDNTGVTYYQPERHKTEHHGKRRRIYLGPKALELLAPWLNRPADAYCFGASEGAQSHYSKIRKQDSGDKKKPSRPLKRPRRPPGARYSEDSYRRAVQRACGRLGIPPWSPNQLRHTRATEIRHKYGIEAAQVVLGHSNAVVTGVYAERNYELAARVMQEIG